MKKYQITVNGTAYEVEVEEIGGAPAVTAASAVSAPAQAPAPASAPAPAQAVSAPTAGATVIESPMPGTILNVLVKPGDAVKKGQVLLILEAMKMENEIVAPADGIVDAVAVAKGASVNAGDVLASIK
ncbi:MAG: biotin/lipoyl-binding protein [Clostridiales bacterium]|nr:biotin/lipoyl-binding protein [Clostridiales bacterium]